MGKVWRERLIIGSLLAACLLLAILQYRWTGELSRAETARLLSSAGGRLQQFTRAFDAELRQSVLDLVPSSEEVRSLGPERASAERLRSAASRLERPLFRRIAAAVPDRSARLHFFEATLDDPRFVEREWPASEDWQTLRKRLEAMARGEGYRGLIVDPNSALIEVPVFVDDSEREWMLFELDIGYTAGKWFPELIRTYLNPEGDDRFLVAVVWRNTPSKHVYGAGGGRAPARIDSEASLFPVRFLGRGGRDNQGRWLVQLTHPAGSVPAAVESARRRNLAVALLLLTLIAAAGAALLRNTREATRLAAAQYQFFAGLSHELRTPLTVIQGAGHNLLSGVVKDEAQRESYLRAIVKQSGQLNEMVEQLLSYGAVRESPEPALQASAVLDVVISEAIDSAALELEQAGRSVDVDMPPDLPAVRGDQGALRRVFGNLILNAIRHGGGEVKVSAALAESAVEVRVADSGQGIPPEELKQVFDPFFRGARARTGRTRGTGLGLSLVKQMVESMGGSVSVESQPGKGTAFTVRLPVAK